MVDFRERLRRVARELAKFGSVGAVAFTICFGLFNVLHASQGAGLGPLTANGIATVIATTFAYFANRYWTFRHRDRTGLGREYSLFFGLNAVGLVITELFLGFGHYVLSMTGALATNGFLVIGTGFATLFRYWAYRRWVFLAVVPPALDTAPAFEPLVRSTGPHPALAQSTEFKPGR
jgi:putative flippase GtrA